MQYDVNSAEGSPPAYAESEFGGTKDSQPGATNIAKTPGSEHANQNGVPEDTSDADGTEGRVTSHIYLIQSAFGNFYGNHSLYVWRPIYIVILILYGIYFGYAMYFRFGDEGSIRLLAMTAIFAVLFVINFIWNYVGGPVNNCFDPCSQWCSRHGEKIAWIVVAVVFAGVIAFLAWDVTSVTKKPYNLVSISGIAFYILLFYIFSFNPAKVRWRPVVWGLALQFIFALLILRTYWGFAAFKWLGDRVSEFLAHTDKGAIFVFGDKYMDHFFAFKVLPVVVFFSTVISILYHLGWMQILIRKVAYVMQVLMGTTAAESLNAAGNIFVGMSEAPLMIRPLLQNMTRSELHAVMTGGFATIAGSVMAAYIQYGVPANHLISASVMSAPAALAMSKLLYPETEKSRNTTKDVQHIARGPERNIIEAAASGASQSVKLVAYIAANLIAFLALLEFVNQTLTWLGHRVGIEPPDYPNLTFQLICAYFLWPAALVMGIDMQDCHKVAELMGIKTFLNEFVAYVELSKYLKNRVAYDAYMKAFPGGNVTYNKGDMFLVGLNKTLAKGILTSRSEVISTYALCGFSNIGSIGIVLGALGAMAPHRRSDLAAIAVRAMIAGNVACFITACIAGLLYRGEY